ncbi:valyl-trna synthetase [hydrocarbon metagenome]|uniref:Valyl-trna synthetase n=1 Tax=hydrocarbon metagenome TaxID=938273 RepID=A0A0W8FZK5_9ZZZZ
MQLNFIKILHIKKLSNEKFVNNAPADVVEKEKTKQHDWAESIEKLKKILVDLN